VDIEKVVGIIPELKKGHNGIFEVYASGKIIYSNQGQCGRLPGNEEIIAKLRKQGSRSAKSSVLDQQVGKGTPEGLIAGSGCT
jgi:hypothetical protein